MTVDGWSRPEFEELARWLNGRTGLAFPAGRIPDAEEGFLRVLERTSVGSVRSYLALLENGKIPLDDLVTELTVGETYFFRAPDQFEFVRRTVLPEILRVRPPTHEVRAWSAGCASGEEAYSLAILFEEEGLAGRERILATDISRSALAKARRGVYGPWSFRGTDATLLRRCFRPSGERWEVEDRFRRRVSFEYHNLALDAFPSVPLGVWGMDIVLCRNVFIYFDPETVRTVARRLWDTLAEGGWLVMGPADPPLMGIVPAEPVVAPAGLFYRKGAPGAAMHSPAEPLGSGVVSHAVVEEEGYIPVEGTAGPANRPGAASGEWTPAVLEADVPQVAREALAAGQYERVVELAGILRNDAGGCALLLRALANARGSAEAAAEASEAVARHPLSVELHFLHSVLLLAAGREGEAVRALRRVVYLDGSVAMAHYTLASILSRVGDAGGARRAYRNALDLCARRRPEEVLPFSDGESAGRLAEVAAASLALLDGAG